ncbi:MAG: hypothetical protein ACFFC7_05545 [Candidatus Hermodarchaeota archaeon]
MIDPLQAVETSLALINEVDSDSSFHYRRNFLRCRVAETLGFLRERSKALALIKRVQDASSTNPTLQREIGVALAKLASTFNDQKLFQKATSLADSLPPSHKAYLIRTCVIEYTNMCQRLAESLPLDEIKQYLSFLLLLKDRLMDSINKKLAYSALISLYGFLARVYKHPSFVQDASNLYRILTSLKSPLKDVLDESIDLSSTYYYFGDLEAGLSLLRDELNKIRELETGLNETLQGVLNHSVRVIDVEKILLTQEEIITGYSKISKAFLMFKDYSTWYSCISQAWNVLEAIDKDFVEVIVGKGCEIYTHTFEGIERAEQDIPLNLLTQITSLSSSKIDYLQKMILNRQEINPGVVWESLLRISKALLVSRNDSLARELSTQLPSTVHELKIFDVTKLYLDLAEYSQDLNYLDPLLEVVSSGLDPQGVYIVRVNCELAEGFSRLSLMLRDSSLVERAVLCINVLRNHSYRLDCVNAWLRIAETAFQFSQ